MRTMYFYHELENKYEEQLNDCYDLVNICGYEYGPGHALRLIDEIAFRCGCSDWTTEDFQEVRAKDMTAEELEHYMISDDQVMYCHNDEFELDEEE